MKKWVFFLTLFMLDGIALSAQQPKNGTYTYTMAFAEWKGRSMGATCTVIIRNDRIKIIDNGKSNLGGKKGDLIEEGILMQHRKTGKWIIGHSRKDTNAKEIGGCSDGPSIIDFKRKRFWTC